MSFKPPAAAIAAQAGRMMVAVCPRIFEELQCKDVPRSIFGTGLRVTKRPCHLHHSGAEDAPLYTNSNRVARGGVSLESILWPHSLIHDLQHRFQNDLPNWLITWPMTDRP